MSCLERARSPAIEFGSTRSSGAECPMFVEPAFPCEKGRSRCSGNGIFRKTFAHLSSAPIHQLSSERGIFHIAVDGWGSMAGDAITNPKESRSLTFHGASQQAADEILP